MDYYRAFPPYMGYQGYGQWAQPGMIPEDRMLEDMEYLQQMYPLKTKKYLSKISEVLNMMDYEGSMIYDQYPDRMQMMETVDTIVKMVKEKDEDEAWLRDLIMVLLCHEVLRRRHKRHRNMYF